MTAPAVGAAVKTATGGKVSREVMRAKRKAAREAKASAAAPTAPETKPVETPITAPAAPVAKTGKTAPAGASRSSMSMPKVSVPSPVSSGAGFVLALLFWTWIALPFLNNGGVTGVRNQLKAKFTNKAPDGSWLP